MAARSGAILRSWIGLVAAAAGAWAAEAPCDGVGGRVVDGYTGAPLARAKVVLLDRVQTSGAAGEFCFRDVRKPHRSVVALNVVDRRGDPVGCAEVSVPVPYYPLSAAVDDWLAVEIVEPGIDRDRLLRLGRVPSEGIEGFCSGCHSLDACMARQRESESGEPVPRERLRGITVQEGDVERVRRELLERPVLAETYRDIRHMDTHALGMDLDKALHDDSPRYRGQYRRPSGLRLLNGGRTNCDTCHARHVPTDEVSYVLLPFRHTNELCQQCHR